jgi:hypothetical protein
LEWRTFAESFRLLVKLSKGAVPEVEMRDHLLNRCHTPLYTGWEVAEERKRESHPMVEIRDMPGWERSDVEKWLRQLPIDVKEVEQKGSVFEVLLRSRAQVTEMLDLSDAEVIGIDDGEYHPKITERGA